MRTIIFFIESIFNKRDFHRYGIDIFIKNGYDVTIWDFSPFLRPEYFKNYSPPDPKNFNKYSLFYDKNEAVKLIKELPDSSIVISFVGVNLETGILYDHLLKNNIKFGFFLSGMLPTTPLSLKQKAKVVIKKTFDSLVKNKKKIPDFLILSGKKSLVDKRYPTGRKTTLIKAHSYDYDRFIETLNHDGNNLGEYAVFLDQYLPHHPDNLDPNKQPDCNIDDYYPPINDFFQNIEVILELKIIIAAHPRSNYEAIGNPFNGRRIIFGKTQSLVKNSKLVFTHFSTSLSFAILYKKPVIFLTHKKLSSYKKMQIKTMASSIEKKPLELSKKYTHLIEKELFFNQERYAYYKEMYIKETGTPEKLIWEIFIEYLKKDDI